MRMRLWPGPNTDTDEELLDTDLTELAEVWQVDEDRLRNAANEVESVAIFGNKIARRTTSQNCTATSVLRPLS
jgi:hypothetical protein